MPQEILQVVQVTTLKNVHKNFLPKQLSLTKKFNKSKMIFDKLMFVGIFKNDK